MDGSAFGSYCEIFFEDLKRLKIDPWVALLEMVKGLPHDELEAFDAMFTAYLEEQKLLEEPKETFLSKVMRR